jgi:hypothetical protein
MLADIVLQGLATMLAVAALLGGWLLVQRSARRFAERHPETGPYRDAACGGHCGSCADACEDAPSAPSEPHEPSRPTPVSMTATPTPTRWQAMRVMPRASEPPRTV